MEFSPCSILLAFKHIVTVLIAYSWEGPGQTIKKKKKNYPPQNKG